MRLTSTKNFFACLVLSAMMSTILVFPAQCKVSEESPPAELRAFAQSVSEVANPTSEQLFELAKAYKWLKDYKSSIKTLDKIILLLPENAVARAFRGSMYKYDGRFKEAKDDLDRAEKLGFKRTGLYAERSAVELVLFEYSNALSDARKASESEPTNPDHLVLLASAKLELGKPVEALADCDRALQLDPKSASALAVRASTYKKLGRLKQANADWQRAHALGWKSPL